MSSRLAPPPVEIVGDLVCGPELWRAATESAAADDADGSLRSCEALAIGVGAAEPEGREFGYDTMGPFQTMVAGVGDFRCREELDGLRADV